MAKPGCTDYYSRTQLSDIQYLIAPLVSEYGTETGTRGKCPDKSILLDTLGQQIKRPKIIDYNFYIGDDQKIEKDLVNGPVIAKLYMPRQLLQFYSAGVLTENQCSNFANTYYNTVITGYTRLGYNGSGPFWQVRGTFGTSWGIKGLMWLEKKIGDQGSGACKIHDDIVTYEAKRY